MKEPVYFLELELENVRCLGQKACLDLSDGKGNFKKWTVILGDNGTGKTSLLQSIAGLEQHSVEYSTNDGMEKRFISKVFLQNKYKKVFINIHKSSSSVNGSLNFKAASENDINTSNVSFMFGKTGIHGTSGKKEEEFSRVIVFGYGANRFMSQKSFNETLSENSETLFDEDAKLINAEEWLLQLDYAASKDSDIKDFAINKRNQVKQILIDLLPDIEEIRFTTPTKENLKSTVEFKTPYAWVTIHQLSLGYKTMVAWMVDLAARMFERYPESDNPLAEPAIVLVDEIDLHLHPKWQRKIFDYLSEKFPATQFIVTAHSPLIVQSAPKDANIVVLRKEGDHVVIDNDVESVQNWRLDQIMSSDLFGIESARGPEIEKWLEERKALIQKETLTTEEKIRLAELSNQTHALPTADNTADIEAMEIIRKAAEYVKRKKVTVTE